MSRHLSAILALLLVSAAACAGNAPSRPVSVPVSGIAVRESNNQNVQFAPSQVLPPYGIKVLAQVAILELRVSTSQKDTAARLKDIREAIDQITLLASKNGAIKLQGISVTQVEGSYTQRKEVSTSNIQNLDTAAVTLKLAINLVDSSDGLIGSIVAFNDFLNTINLADTMTVQATAVKTEVGDLEEYRHQLVDRVYQDLDLAQKKYSRPVKFEATGLYDPLKMMQLSDTEYYIYLEPVVKVNEF
jgi:hypothetical protein